MKTFLECVGEAAQKQGDEGFMNWLIFKLDNQQLEQLARAAEIYASQSNSHKHGVMQGLPTILEMFCDHLFELGLTGQYDGSYSLLVEHFIAKHKLVSPPVGKVGEDASVSYGK